MSMKTKINISIFWYYQMNENSKKTIIGTSASAYSKENLELHRYSQ